MSVIYQKSSEIDVKQCIKWKDPDVNPNDRCSYFKKIEFLKILTLF